MDFLITKDDIPFMLVECKTSLNEPLNPALVEFQKTLSVPYAFQVGIDAPSSGVEPLEYEGTAIKLSALDLMRIFV